MFQVIIIASESTSYYKIARRLLVIDLIIVNFDQVTRTTPQLALLLFSKLPHHVNGWTLSLDTFNVDRLLVGLYAADLQQLQLLTSTTRCLSDLEVVVASRLKNSDETVSKCKEEICDDEDQEKKK
ncbi:hypothetical protein TNCV_1729301 [Trichonephila clavipes]|nr:hypothetical protein TNCV_1729301 [Trichonephila clavipes]